MRPEQVIAALRFDPLLPIWLIVAIAVIAAAVCALAVWRRAKGAVLRALAFAMLLLWLAGPRLVRETREALPDIGLLVVDQTASMQVNNRSAVAEAAQAAIRDEARQFKDLDLRTITVPEKGDAGTLLFGEIERAIGEIPRSRLAGIVAITDGQIHDVPKAVPGDVPLNILIPAKGEETDRRLRIIEAPGFGIVGKPVTLRVAVDDLGSRGHGQATLTLRRDGEPPRETTVPIGREQQIEVPITRAGPTVVELSASPLPGEVSTINNRAVVEINGVRDRLRVLLISGEPHPGRTRVAAAAEIRSIGRSGAFHHFASSGKGRHDAAERTRADRVSGARTVSGQNWRVRPDHPGSLPESRSAADAVSGQHRQPGSRRAAHCY